MDKAFLLSKAEFQIEQAVAQIHKLAAENQTLDWEIPSQYDRLLRNVDSIERIEVSLIQLKATVARLNGDPIERHARAAVQEIFAGLPPVTQMKRNSRVIQMKRPKVIRRGHLTLVHSKG